MKTKIISLCFFVLNSLLPVYAQSFVNLDFESAHIPPGTQPITLINTTSALPGWNAYSDSSMFGIQPLSQIYYDAISGGGAQISLDDTNASAGLGLPFTPLQGKYSAVLQGGGSGSQYSVTISQTGMVPAGTESLQAYIGVTTLYGYPIGAFSVTLGGQIINMVPLQTFSTYTVYGGDMSTFAGQVETLSFTEPPPVGVPPSMLILDNIMFSTSPVPEPGTLALVATGAVFLGLRRSRKG
jgi:hypothetical protein